MLFALTNEHRLLADAPAPFTSRHHGREPMFDSSGEDVDDESTCGVEASDQGRAVLSWSDDRQAGFTGMLTVYPSVEEYRQGLEAAIAESRESLLDPEE